MESLAFEFKQTLFQRLNVFAEGEELRHTHAFALVLFESVRFGPQPFPGLSALSFAGFQALQRLGKGDPFPFEQIFSVLMQRLEAESIRHGSEGFSHGRRRSRE